MRTEVWSILRTVQQPSVLLYDIDGITYELIANAQPRSLNGINVLGDNNDSIYLAVQEIGASWAEIGFVASMAFLERFYTVFDTGDSLLGFTTVQLNSPMLL
jgi:cathepsin E